MYFTSPLQRARRTGELAGFGAEAKVDNDLVEWNYGEYKGLRTAEIHAKRPGWQLLRDGCPGGEAPREVGARADRVLERVHAVRGDVLIFSSIYRIYAESFRDRAHLNAILSEAQEMVKTACRPDHDVNTNTHN